jgi:hypothetical protein
MVFEMHMRESYLHAAKMHLLIKFPPALQRVIATQNYIRGLRSAALDTADACSDTVTLRQIISKQAAV